MEDIRVKNQNSLRNLAINSSAFFSATIRLVAFFVFFILIFDNLISVFENSFNSFFVKSFCVLVSFFCGNILGGKVSDILVNLVSVTHRVIIPNFPVLSKEDYLKIKKISKYWYLLLMTIGLSISWHYLMYFTKAGIDNPGFLILLALPSYFLAHSIDAHSDSTYYWIVAISFLYYLDAFNLFLKDIFGINRLKIGAKNLIFFSFGVLVATGLSFSLLYDIYQYDWLKVDNDQIESLGQPDIVFFSFVSLSNLGYGSITPINLGMVVCTLQNMIALFVTGVFLASSVNYIGSLEKGGSDS